MIVNIHEAKTHLSRLVARAAAGEDIVIGKAGVPMARLVAYRAEGPLRRFGYWKGRVATTGDWDSEGTNQAIERMFRGEDTGEER